MSRIDGRFKGIENSHTAQTPKAKMPKMYEDAFSSLNINYMQASFKAYMKATEKENPLSKRELKPFKKDQYPLGGKKISGPLPDIPSNRGS